MRLQVTLEMHMTRTRTRPKKVYAPAGYKYVYNGRTTSYTEPGYTVEGDLCQDNLSPGFPNFLRDNDLLMNQLWHSPARLDGNLKKTSGSGTYVYDDTLFRETWIIGKKGSPENMSYWQAMAMSSMDPLKPVVNMPVELIELLTELPLILVSFLRSLRRPVIWDVKRPWLSSDSPSYFTNDGVTRKNPFSWSWHTTYTPSFGAMLRRAFRERYGVSAAAGSYVMGSFAILPLMGLIHKLVNFDELMQKRMRELEALENRKIHRVLDDQQSPGGTTTSTGTWLNVPYTQSVLESVSKKVWFTADWYWMNKPDFLGGKPGGVDKFNQAYKYMLGVDRVRLEDLWEVIPFSWLIDYFTNLGSVIGAWGGTARFQARNLNVMCRKSYGYTCTLAYKGDAVSKPSFQTGTYKSVWKQRLAGGEIPALAFSERLLSSHQLAILTSILGSVIFSVR